MKEGCETCVEANKLGNLQKWYYTLLTTLVFVAVSNPYTYLLVNSLLGGILGSISDKKGCPTTTGFIVHTIVFTLILRLLM
jgi:hypothetical protein